MISVIWMISIGGVNMGHKTIGHNVVGGKNG